MGLLSFPFLSFFLGHFFIRFILLKTGGGYAWIFFRVSGPVSARKISSLFSGWTPVIHSWLENFFCESPNPP